MEADIQEQGACILPARLLFDIIRRLPEGPVNISVDNNFKVEIRAGFSNFHISASNAEDYPELPDVENRNGVCIPQGALRDMISGTIFAVSENQSRPIHTGCLFEVENESILDWRRVVPTDCPIKLTANVNDMAATIDRVGLIVTEKLKSPVRCLFGDQVATFRTSTTIGAAEDQCPIAGNGEELEIGFNCRYLADALRAIPSEEVCLELKNGLSPIVLTPVREQDDFAYMVLPVRLRSN